MQLVGYAANWLCNCWAVPVGYAAGFGGLCSWWAMQLASVGYATAGFAAGGFCSCWTLQLVGFAAGVGELCSWWALQLVGYATGGLFGWCAMQLVDNAAGGPCS